MVRFLTLSAVFVATLPLFAQDGADPVVRMATMHNALSGAKTIKVVFDSEIQSEKGKDWVKGTMLIGEENKARVEMKMKIGENTTDLLMISDGKTMQTISGKNPPREKQAEVKLRENMIAMIERAGIAVPMFTIRTKKDDATVRDLTKSLRIFDLKLVESGDKAGVYKCSYKLEVEAMVRFRVELSMGLESRLPQSRILTVEKGANAVTVRETYTIELNPDIKEDAFALRKAE